MKGRNIVRTKEYTQDKLPQSSYEEYALTSKSYDITRQPIGIDFIVGKINLFKYTSGKEFNDISVLDAGCGTGNYVCALKERMPQINVTGIEVNSGMLNKAKRKVAGLGLRGVSLRLGSFLNMKQFRDNTFDIVFINQVLHHLTKPKNLEAPYRNVRKGFAEIYRVLKPRGLLLVNSCSHIQMRQGFWYVPFMRKAVRRFLAFLCPIDTLKASIF